MSYPIIICEDQFLQLQQLESIIQNYILFHSELFQIKLKTQSPIEVKTYLKQFQPKNGIYFLDIDLNHSISGIDLAEMIRKADVQAKIIFVTTHDELAPLTSWIPGKIITWSIESLINQCFTFEPRYKPSW